ncbi:MAG: heat-inducible transcription repressor HrcA, partial [Deltaproteobacteria bacterium]
MKKRILKHEAASGLTERQGAILAAIVKEYILSAEPVGSKAVASSYSASLGGVSPATIRNIMAELEGAGYLAQPHTSAGRVPTEKGFRFYVDSLLEVEEPTEEAKEFLRKCLDGPSNIEDMLTGTTRVLSSLTGCAGLLFIPERESFVIRHISLLPVERNSLVVVFVSTLGLA